MKVKLYKKVLNKIREYYKNELNVKPRNKEIIAQAAADFWNSINKEKFCFRIDTVWIETHFYEFKDFVKNLKKKYKKYSKKYWEPETVMKRAILGEDD